ncbi:hypothetical protein CJ010_14395 [Azoarcus sp. DD4]|nr:hypothetical protein CJ010_14395 [Azoarcus sp. DD4]
MDFRESMIHERYKLVTSRQLYLVDLTKDTFASYARTLAAFVAGTITLVSAAEKLSLSQAVVLDLILAIAVFLSFAASISVAQILFCIKRWYEYRAAECKINPDAPRAEWWACLFEAMYAAAILGSIGLVWWGYFYLGATVGKVATSTT